VGTEQPVSTAVENFAEELRAWRERMGLSQAELGARMGYSGSHVSSVETMSRTPTLEFAKKCDEALDTPRTFARLHGQINGRLPAVVHSVRAVRAAGGTHP
jgi:transcriptional regulator with XRE-family HTH domain